MGRKRGREKMNQERIKVGEIIQGEWQQILRDKRLFAILMLVPIMYTLMFGYLYSHHRVTDIKTVVYDGDHSQLSRQIIMAFDQSEYFHVTGQIDSEQDVPGAVDQGRAQVGVVIPKGLSAKLKHGENVPILTVIDGSNMLFSNAALRAANQIVSTFSVAVSARKLQLQQGLQAEQLNSTIAPIPFRTRILYNPSFNYSYFLTFGLIGAILQQVLLLGVALTVTRDKEIGRWDSYRCFLRTPWRLAYGKTAPYFLIGFVNTIIAFVLSFYIFQLPFRGFLVPSLILSASFVFALLGIGYVASQFSPNQLQATQTTMLVAVPSFLLSGFTWPFDAMPQALSILGHLLPLTYFLDGVREVFVKGHGMDFIWRDCVVLGLTGLLCYFAAFLLMPFQLKKEAGN
jgi:ABC-2 type transport system permease protein